MIISDRLITALFVASAAILLAGCKSTHTIEQVPVEVAKVVKDTVHVTNVERDSIYLHDSVEVRGDTVTRWHTGNPPDLTVDYERPHMPTMVRSSRIIFSRSSAVAVLMASRTACIGSCW